MSDAKFEEVIRLAFETGGTEAVMQAASILAKMGDVSEEARAQAADLLDTLGNAEKTSRAIEQYRQIGLSVVDYQRQITQAKAHVIELADALKQTDAPSKAQQRELDKARAGVSALVAAQQREVAQLRDLKGQIEGQGISLRSIGTAQQQVAERTAQASTSLRAMVGDLRSARAADAAFQADLAAATAKAKAETAQYDAALKRVRRQIEANAAAAKEGGEAMESSLERTRGMLERLREPLAALTAFFSFEALKEGIKSIFETGDQFEQFQRKLTGLYGTADKGKEAFEWVKEFTTQTPLKLDDTMAAFVRLKKFGIDPMGGALQALVDYNAKMGGDAEQLEAIADALTKASTRGQIDMRGLIALTEAGVPVFDMLANATGKTSGEIQNLAQQGLLGADAVQQLIQQMGKIGAGGAANELEDLSAQWTVFTENVDDFRDRVARGGVLDYFRDQLQSLNGKIAEWAANGTLDIYAKRISDGIVSLAESVKSAGKFIADHITQIKRLAQAYAAFKIGSILVELGTFAARLATVAMGAIRGVEAIGALSRGMVVFRTAVVLLSGPIGLATAALGAFAIGAKLAADRIESYAEAHSDATKKMQASEEAYRETVERLSEQWEHRAEQMAQYQDVQTQTMEQVAKMTSAERAAYQERLSGYIEYTRDRLKAAQFHIAANKNATDEEKKDAADLAQKFREAQQGAEDFQKGVDLVTRSAAAGMTVSAQQIADSIRGVLTQTDKLHEQIDKQFIDLGQRTPQQLGDIALAFADLAKSGDRSARDIRAAWNKNLAALSGEDLHAFQTAANLAFITVGTDAKQTAAQMDDYLQAALGRLGVSMEQWGAGATEAGRQNAELFLTVAENAKASASTIEAAFSKALANSTTAADAAAIGDAMASAGQRGAVGFEATQRAVKAVKDRIVELQDALDPLNASFAGLGITSQRMLDAAAKKAHDLFDNIVQGARRGEASMADVRRAFEPYARAQLDAVSGADEWQKAQVKASLAVQASIYGVTEGLDGMGDSGLKAGSAIATGAHHAAKALADMSTAAADAADKVDQSSESLEDGADKAGKSARAYQEQFRPAAIALNGFSAALIKAYAAQNQYAGNVNLWVSKMNEITAQWRGQKDLYDEMMANLDHQNAAYDDMAKRVEELRRQFGYLTDEQLRNMAAAQQALKENEARAKQAHDEALKRNDEANAQQTARWEKERGGPTAGEPGAGGVHRHEIDLRVSSAPAASGAGTTQLAHSDVQRVAKEIVRQIGIAQLSANR